MSLQGTKTGEIDGVLAARIVGKRHRRSNRGDECRCDHDDAVETEDADREAQNQALNPRRSGPTCTSDDETAPKRSSCTDSATTLLVPLKFSRRVWNWRRIHRKTKGRGGNRRGFSKEEAIEGKFQRKIRGIRRKWRGISYGAELRKTKRR